MRSKKKLSAGTKKRSKKRLSAGTKKRSKKRLSAGTKKRSKKRLSAGTVITKHLNSKSSNVSISRWSRYVSKKSVYSEYTESTSRKFKLTTSPGALRLKVKKHRRIGREKDSRITIRIKTEREGWISISPLSPPDGAMTLAEDSIRRYGSERLGKIKEIEIYEISKGRHRNRSHSVKSRSKGRR